MVGESGFAPNIRIVKLIRIWQRMVTYGHTTP